MKFLASPSGRCACGTCIVYNSTTAATLHSSFVDLTTISNYNIVILFCFFQTNVLQTLSYNIMTAIRWNIVYIHCRYSFAIHAVTISQFVLVFCVP